MKMQLCAKTKTSIGCRSHCIYAVCVWVLLSLFLQLLISFAPLQAYAASWPFSSNRLSPSLGFQDSYSAGNKTYKHYGVDIEAAAGSNICAPVSGNVSFVGQVPSGDSMIDGGGAGNTMNAVSIKMSDGRTLTLMPVAQAFVSTGASVSEGQSLGTLAAGGDRSSTSTHLHMGLKKNGTYYDPMSLFGAAPATPVPAEQESYSYADETASVALDSAALEESFGFSAEPASSNVFQEGAISSADALWQPAAQTHELNIFERIGVACADQFFSIVDELQYLATETGVPAIVFYIAAIVAALVVCACASVAFVRFCLPSLKRASHLAILHLSEKFGGDIMHRLFPAWGLAFKPLSHIDQRR